MQSKLGKFVSLTCTDGRLSRLFVVVNRSWRWSLLDSGFFKIHSSFWVSSHWFMISYCVCLETGKLGLNNYLITGALELEIGIAMRQSRPTDLEPLSLMLCSICSLSINFNIPRKHLTFGMSHVFYSNSCAGALGFRGTLDVSVVSFFLF